MFLGSKTINVTQNEKGQLNVYAVVVLVGFCSCLIELKLHLNDLSKKKTPKTLSKQTIVDWKWMSDCLFLMIPIDLLSNFEFFIIFSYSVYLFFFFCLLWESYSAIKFQYPSKVFANVIKIKNYKTFKGIWHIFFFHIKQWKKQFTRFKNKIGKKIDLKSYKKERLTSNIGLILQRWKC